MGVRGELFYGDNLDVMRRHINTESVDLVYLDPPFNSDADYNLLFAEQDGSRSASQIKAFEDTWRWDCDAAGAFDEVVESGGEASRAMQAFRTVLGASNMLAYLAMMAPRLLELRRTLKPSGSLYLHCDPTASHYLKLLLDAVFGPENFRNEVIWQRTLSKGLTSRRLPTNHDVLLAYQRGEGATWNQEAAFLPYDPAALDGKTAQKYSQIDADGRRYQLTSLLNPNRDRPNLEYEFLGVTRVWRWTRDRMQAAYEAGAVVQPRPGAVPRYKRYLDEQKGRPLGDVWTDIPPLNSRAAERLGYPTQKPSALLERIIEISSVSDALVLDPFCGCGTTIAAAERLGRRWIGIDITFQATNLIKSRLLASFGETVDYTVTGEPTTLNDAGRLALEDRDQFEAWALGLVGARNAAKKKGRDHGIDGRLYFHEKRGGKTRQVVISVKSGKIGVAEVRELRGVIEREDAEIGLLITMREPTKAMVAEALAAGFYRSGSEGVGSWGKHPRLQILSVEQLLDGARIDMPPISGSLNLGQAPRVERRRPTTQPLFQNLDPSARLGEVFD
jgi:site-specific DNA-methyltransferase (adenine-specific)